MPAQHASKDPLTAGTGPRDLRVPLIAGAVIGVAQTATPFAFWWLPPATVYALGLVFIAAVYIGFSVADGRWKVIAAEVAVAIALTGPAWLLVAGLTGHGLKRPWQHRTQFVTGTRWWPPFCAAVDFVVAAILAIALAAGANVR